MISKSPIVLCGATLVLSSLIRDTFSYPFTNDTVAIASCSVEQIPIGCCSPEDTSPDDDVDAPEDGRAGFPNRYLVQRGDDVGEGRLNKVGSLMGAPCDDRRNPLVASPLCFVDGAMMTSSW